MIKLKDILQEQKIAMPKDFAKYKKSRLNRKYTVPEHKDFKMIGSTGKIFPLPPYDGDFSIWYDQLSSNFKPANKSNPKYVAATEQFFKDLKAYNKAKTNWIYTVTDEEIRLAATAEYKRDKAIQDADNDAKQKEIEKKYNITGDGGYINVNGNRYTLELHIPKYTESTGNHWFMNTVNKAEADWVADTATMHLDMPYAIDTAWYWNKFTSSDVVRGNVTNFDEYDSNNFTITLKMDDKFKEVIDQMSNGDKHIEWSLGGTSKGKLIKQ